MKTLSLFALLTLTAGTAAAQQGPGYSADDGAVYDDGTPRDDGTASDDGDGYGYGDWTEADRTADVDDGYDPQAYTQFEAQLAPYGTWSDDPSYGRLWWPSENVVGAGFTPYATGGHWVWTDRGWTWASDWDWGWAPFHYGRWITVGSRWCWRPGRVWGPAWVSWRHRGNTVGWAPLPPRFVVRDHRGYRPTWRSTVASQLGAPRASYVRAHGPGFGAGVAPRAYRAAPPPYRPAPRMDRPAPQFRGPAPQFRGSAPQFRGPAPQFRGPAPQFHGSAPQLRGSAPQLRGPAPQMRSAGPGATFRGGRSHGR